MEKHTMSKRFVTRAVLSLVLLCLSGGMLGYALVKSGKTAAEPAYGTSQETVVTDENTVEGTEQTLESQPLYIVKIEGEDVIAEPTDGGDPIVLAKIDPRTLRQTDRESLKRGINVYTKEELEILREDFGS